MYSQLYGLFLFIHVIFNMIGISNMDMGVTGRYSPNIKEIKVLDKKKVRRAQLYYISHKLNALKGR